MNQSEIEKMRMELTGNRIQEFIESFVNPEDVAAQRANMIVIITYALEKLLDVESSYIQELLTAGHEGDEMCPGCLVASTKDYTQVQMIAKMFNNYLGGSGCNE